MAKGMTIADTGWRRPTGCLKLQVIFCRRATKYRALYRDYCSAMVIPFAIRGMAFANGAMCCSALQYVAVCCSVLQCVALCQNASSWKVFFPLPFGEWHSRMVRESLRVCLPPWILIPIPIHSKFLGGRGGSITPVTIFPATKKQTERVVHWLRLTQWLTLGVIVVRGEILILHEVLKSK